jgi:uncharacterized protein YgbK (DUF1537 family)
VTGESSGVASRLLAWYGDDFTGSTDALEALASNGIRSVLFLQQPDEPSLSRFHDYQAFGLAGSSRSESPEWMDANLPRVFEWLRSLETPLCHYKVCSTFDSSPEIGNIGRAIETGRRVFESRCVPVLVGVPSLRRYVVFGNLFATADGHTWRIDRHPTMSRHPVTPMHEADLLLHLRHQTDLPARLFHILDLSSADSDQRYGQQASKPGILVLDTLDQVSLLNAGRLLWNGRAERRFVTGSSGVEYGLTEWWRSAGVIGPQPARAVAPPVGRVLVVSGSCSPTTERQIAAASRNGFYSVRVDAMALATGQDHDKVVTDAICASTQALANGRSVVLFTAAGPSDTVPIEHNNAGTAFRRGLAEQTGKLLCAVLDRSGVSRVVVAGGDTSSHAGKQLDIDALTYAAPLAPGAPICRAWSRNRDRDGLEIVFKGGQCGDENFFSAARQGQQGLQI